MAQYNNTTREFSPAMYPVPRSDDRPVPPPRSEMTSYQPDDHLLPPVPPKRMDEEPQNESRAASRNECSCNYNRYATKKTIGHGFLEFALITSNAMQLRTLIVQKQHDGIWLASLLLVCLSIVAQIGLGYILLVMGKGDIQNPQKQEKLERWNNIALFITMVISVINLIINVFMSTTNPNSYLDTAALELLKTTSGKKNE